MNDKSSQHAGKRILIAEDEEFIANLYKINLETHGVKAEVVLDGKSAIESLENGAPNLLLLDLLMPDTDGFQVLEYMKEHNINIPVVVLTNLSQEIDREKCEQMGVRDFFVKSDLSVEELWDKISGYL